MARSLRSAGKVVALLATSVLVCLAAAELVVRLRYDDKFGRRPGFYTNDDRLGWRPAPNLGHVFYGPDYQIAIRTDADGYRLGALGEVAYSEELVILCGDSYAFGWGVSTDQSFASYLDEILARQSNGRLRVVNLGVGGYGAFQNCDRLADFFRKHKGVASRLVLVQHTGNDATDNIRNIGYHLGIWPTEPIVVERSRFHLANLVRYLRDVRAQGPQPVENPDPRAHDLLWAFRRKEARGGIPARVEFGTRTVEFQAATLRADVNADTLARRNKLSQSQHDLMFEALNCIHSLARAHDLVVVHTFIAATQEWYVKEVGNLARESADSTGCRIVVTAAMPAPDEFAPPIRNTHSGGHFTPEFNRFWAEKMLEFLNQEQLFWAAASNKSTATRSP